MSLRLSKREFKEVYISMEVVNESFLILSLVYEQINENYVKLAKFRDVTLEEYDDGHVRITGIGDQDLPITISSNNWILFGKYW